MPTSNYFEVRHVPTFLEWVDSIPGLEAETRRIAIRPGRHATVWRLVFPGSEWLIKAANGTDLIDLFEEVVPHLLDDGVAVFKETYQVGGSMRGLAIAVNGTGGLVKLTLDDIYGLARQRFGGAPIYHEHDF
jgi:hypothetical protein